MFMERDDFENVFYVVLSPCRPIAEEFILTHVYFKLN